MSAAPVVIDAWSHKAESLSRSQAVEMSATGLVDVRPRDDGWWLLSTNSRVGVAVGVDWELRVSPKLDVSSLMFLLAYARDPSGWRDSRADFAPASELFDAIAVGFSLHALAALKRGALHGYRNVDERLTAIRGRIRFGDQIARRATLPLPVEVAYDDFTVDVLENQMVKTAAQYLLALARVPAPARRRLLHVRALLDEVSYVERPREVRAPRLTRLNARYGPALRLAELILRSSSIDAERGGVTSAAFVFDMNKVFEDFVTAALGEAIRPYGGELRDQVKEKRLSEHIALRPDLAWNRGGQWEAVLDVKYKPLYSDSFPNADAYQMLAYTLAYGLEEGWLIYAKMPGQESRTHDIASAGKRIVVTALDVRREPVDLLADVAALAQDIASSRSRLEAA